MPKVSWRRLICNNKASPKSIFILWLSLWNRLVTKDRLIRWGINCDPICILCLEHQESVQHLCFECPYAKEIWSRILVLLKLNKLVLCFDQG